MFASNGVVINPAASQHIAQVLFAVNEPEPTSVRVIVSVRQATGSVNVYINGVDSCFQSIYFDNHTREVVLDFGVVNFKHSNPSVYVDVEPGSGTYHANIIFENTKQVIRRVL